MSDFYYTNFDGCFDSSAFDGAWYNSDTGDLVLKFASGGEYQYPFADDLWGEFVNAGSKGRYWRQHISGKIHSTPVYYEQFLWDGSVGVEDETPRVYANSLVLDEAAVQDYAYTVTFFVNGTNGEFNTVATSDHGAVAQFRELTDRLGLTDEVVEAQVGRVL